MNAVSPAPSSDGLKTFQWRAATLAVMVTVAVIIAIYRETALGMVTIWWRSETFTHAFLVAPISLWLIWEKRKVLARFEPQPSLWLALPLLALAFAWLLGELAAVNAVTQLAFTAMLILAVPLVIGIPAARQILFPLCFLFFAVPIGEFVMPKFMEWTATMTVLGLRASGVPVFQEGLQFVIPSGRWSVVEACSGVRYLIASLTIGTLFAYLNYRSLNRRLIFVAVSIIVPIIANWIRAYIIVMLGHFSGNELAVGADHLIYGWVFFGIVILIMFAIGIRWREDDDATDQMAQTAAASAAAKRNSHGTRQGFVMAALLALSIALLPYVSIKVLNAQNSGAAPILSVQALATGGWAQDAQALSTWQPAFANPSTTEIASFSQGARHVGVHIAYYRHQGYDRKLISSENVLVKSGDENWLQLEQGSHSVILTGTNLMVRSAQLKQQSTLTGEPVRLRVWQWYWIDGQLTSSDHLGKLWLALARLRGHGDDSAAVFVYAREDLPGGADAALEKFLADTGPGFNTVFEQARQAR
jgi:exosortase A